MSDAKFSILETDILKSTKQQSQGEGVFFCITLKFKDKCKAVIL